MRKGTGETPFQPHPSRPPSSTLTFYNKSWPFAKAFPLVLKSKNATELYRAKSIGLPAIFFPRQRVE